MDEKKNGVSPGPRPYTFEAVPGSHDLDILSSDGKTIARVHSQASGHENAPDDLTAQQNLTLFRHALRMRDTLDVLLEREHEPMHPYVADAARNLLTDIQHGDGATIAALRERNREREALHGRMRAASELSKQSEEDAEDPSSEGPHHSF